MSDNQIDVKIGGNATGAVAAMSEATTAVKGGVESMKGSVESLGAAFEKFKSTFMVLSAVLAGGAAFKAAISAANSWNGQVGAMAKQMGITTQQASVMSVALHGIGVSTDTYRNASMMMTRQIASNEGAFKTLGVSVKDVHTGALRPIGDVMSEVNTKLGSIHNATERNTAGMKVYGRGWSEVQGVLKLNASAMKEAQETAERLHLIVGPEGIAQSKAYAKEQRELSLVGKSLEIQVGNALLPVMVKLGAWLGGIGPSVADNFSKSMDLLSTAVEGVWEIFKSFNDTVVSVCSSIVSAVAEAFGSKLPGNFDFIGSCVKVVQSLFVAFKFAVLEVIQFVGGCLEVAAKNFSTFCRVANAALRLDFSGAKSEYEAGFAAVEAIVKKHAANMVKIKADADAQLKEIHNPTKKKSSGSSEPESSDQHLDFSKGSAGKDKKAKSASNGDQIAAWKEELEQKKETSGDFFKQDLAMEEAFWQSKLALVKGNGKLETAERRKINQELYNVHKQQAQQERQLKEENISHTEKMGQQEISEAKAVIQAKKDMGQISETQEIQELQKLKDQEYQIELKALQDKLAIYQQDKLAKQKLLDEIALLEKQHAASSQQSANQVALAQKKQTEAMLTPISSAMDKTITGMIMGTQTLKQAQANIMQNILGEFVSTCTKRLVLWAATETGIAGISQQWDAYMAAMEKSKTAQAIATKSTEVPAAASVNAAKAASAAAAETAMTTSSATGAAARTTLSTTSATAAVAAKATEATAVVSGNAAEAASGAAASVAAIPVAGWAMSPGVFASTLALVLGAKSMIPSASKGFDIPAGVNPLTQLHEKEMVLPAEHAEAIRSMTGGSSGGASHLHVHATDASSVQRLFQNNGKALTKVMKEQQRRFAK